MEAKARITDNLSDRSEGSYGVSYGCRAINPVFAYYQDFETAYLAACEYVGWKLSNITIEVYPQFVRDVLKRVTHEQVKLKMKAVQEKEYSEYQQYIGDARRLRAEELIITAPGYSDELLEKIKKAYQAGEKEGRKKFLEENNIK
jgi:hypothetical protein